MRPVIVKNVRIGEGIPKICVPIVGTTKKEILCEAKQIKATTADVVEWRVDWYEDALKEKELLSLLMELSFILKEIPLLFTCRSKIEGGQLDLTLEEYEELNRIAIESRCIDLVDIEFFYGSVLVSRMIEFAHCYHVKAVVSNHDFHATPAKKELIKRMTKMIELGADLPKIAVMPGEKQDVLVLLKATLEMQELYPNHPIVTMSMQMDGVCSRLCGEIFGSAMTFGSLTKPSAPGQIPVADLTKILKIIHKQKNIEDYE